MVRETLPKHTISAVTAARHTMARPGQARHTKAGAAYAMHSYIVGSLANYTTASYPAVATHAIACAVVDSFYVWHINTPLPIINRIS
jgi:hypothetical protein